MSDKNILVVDDEEMIRNLYLEAFTGAGFTVETAESAEAALEIMRKSPFPVLFLDLKLPGMNGVELCRHIRRDWPMTISYAVTGYARLFELHSCREAGFEDYFIKPVKLSDLIEAAEHAFQKVTRWKKRTI
jgi:CheY-like chemotaxis protein